MSCSCGWLYCVNETGDKSGKAIQKNERKCADNAKLVVFVFELGLLTRFSKQTQSGGVRTLDAPKDICAIYNPRAAVMFSWRIMTVKLYNTL